MSRESPSNFTRIAVCVLTVGLLPGTSIHGNYACRAKGRVLTDAGSTPAASTKNRKGSSQGGPFLFSAAVTAEPAPEGKGGRSEAEVCVAVAKTQTPAASTKLKSRSVQLHLINPVYTGFFIPQ